jgi:hypothetical protein
VFAVTGVGLWFYINLEDPVTFDKDSCPTNYSVSELVVVIIDQTDPITPIQRQKILEQLKRAKADLPQYGEMQIYTVGSVNLKTLPIAFRGCNPGSKDQINKYTQPIKIAISRWNSFNRKFDEYLSGVLQSTSENTSPIIESIRSVGVTAFSRKQYDQLPKKLIIVSDMLQNSALFSHYRVWTKCTFTDSGEKCDVIHDRTGECMKFGGRHQQNCKEVEETNLDFEHWDRLLGNRLHADLQGVNVEVLYIRRRDNKQQGGGDHIVFWRDYFSSNGVTKFDAESINP